MRVVSEKFGQMTLEPDSDLDRRFLEMVNKSKVTQITEFTFNPGALTFTAKFCFEYPRDNKGVKK